MKYEKLVTVGSISELLCSKVDSSILIDTLKSFDDKTHIMNCFFNYRNPLNSNGAPSIAIPKNWIHANNKNEPMYLNMLFNAYVYGGSITQRNGWYHNEGQLLLTQNKNIIKPSFNIMDGHRSLPENLIVGDYENEKIDHCKLKYDGNIKFERGTYYFVGSFHRHFGHFLLEGLARLWALDYLPKKIMDELKFIVYEDDIKPFAIAMMELYGIEKDRIISPGRCSQYEKIFVPDTSYRTHRLASCSFLNHINVLKSKFDYIRGDRKVFLSRKHVHDRRLLNRDEIESFFIKKGFEIIYPEKITLDEQIKTIMQSTHIAGEVGTQMYLSMFARKGISVTVLAPSNFYLKDDYLISRLLNLNLKVILGSEIDFKSKSRIRPYSIDIQDINDYFKEIDCD